MGYQETLRVQDVINGALGAVYLVENGQRELLMNCKDINAEFKKNKKEIKVLGSAGAKHKATGWSGTGSMTMYYGTSKLREAAIKYINEGIDAYYEMVVTNEDPSSDIGSQSVVLTGVNFDNTVIAKIDINSTELDEQINFTYQGANILEKFKDYVGE